MNIILIDMNREMTSNWEVAFDRIHCPNLQIVTDEFSNFMKHNNVDCIVSPANSFGLMDGGYDKAIIDYFGQDLQDAVQKYILENYFGEQPIGSSFIIDIPNWNGKKLIHTPTMQTPSIIKDPMTIYTCFRSTLICAFKNLDKNNTILIPAFGGCTGKVPYDIIAKYMMIAITHINPPNKLNWGYALYLKNLLNQ